MLLRSVICIKDVIHKARTIKIGTHPNERTKQQVHQSVLHLWDHQLDERRHHSQTQVEQNHDRFFDLTDASLCTREKSIQKSPEYP